MSLPNRSSGVKSADKPAFKKGEFFKCHEKLSPGHQCKPKTLNCIEGGEQDSEADNEVMADEIPEEAENDGAVVLSAITGRAPASTIKIAGFCHDKPVSILVDTGSTHSFIDPRVLKEAKLKPTKAYSLDHL